jgi:hypothetical protein
VQHPDEARYLDDEATQEDDDQGERNLHVGQQVDDDLFVHELDDGAVSIAAQGERYGNRGISVVTGVAYSGERGDNREAMVRADEAMDRANKAVELATEAKHSINSHERECVLWRKLHAEKLDQVLTAVGKQGDAIEKMGATVIDLGAKVQSSQDKAGNYLTREWLLGYALVVFAGMASIIWYLVKDRLAL